MTSKIANDVKALRLEASRIMEEIKTASPQTNDQNHHINSIALDALWDAERALLWVEKEYNRIFGEEESNG